MPQLHAVPAAAVPPHPLELQQPVVNSNSMQTSKHWVRRGIWLTVLTQTGKWSGVVDAVECGRTAVCM